MKKAIVSAVAMAAVGSLTPLTAWAQDRCADVLQDGAFQTANYRDNSYFRQILIYRFLRSTYEQSKSDRTLGLGIPLGEVFLEGNYSQQDFDRRQAQLRQEFSSDTAAAREIDIALSSGDAAIVGAWERCMALRGGGLLFHIESRGPQEAIAELDFLPALGVTETTLTADVAIPPGVRVTNGQDCLRRGYVVRATVTCLITFTLDDATRPLLLAVNTRAGAASAYLPPRMVYRTEIIPFSLDPLYYAHKGVQTSIRTATVDLSAEQIGAGWRFDVRTFVIGGPHVQRAFKGSTCDNLESNATAYNVSYRYRHIARDNSSTTICKLTTTVMIRREVWMKQGAPGQVPAALPAAFRPPPAPGL